MEGPRTIRTLNPATEEVLAEVSALDAEGALAAVAAAKAAFPGWAATPHGERERLLASWLEIMVEEADALAELVAMEGGKPVAEARLVDLFPACEVLSYYAKHLHELLAFQPVTPNQLLFRHWKAAYRFDPLGVVAVITPWNYPVGIPMAELVQAVAAGNTVVFKPASATVLVGLALGDMARRAGFPPGVINAVALPGSVTDTVLDNPDVAKVLFTGSVDIGRHVARRCADRLAPCVLELGGKDAAVVSINDHAVPFAEPTGCWGGVRESGLGRTHGRFGLYELVNIKYVAHDAGDAKASPWYYPYDADFGNFMDAALPALYGSGGGKVRALTRLSGTKRFIERVRKGTLIRNLKALW